MERHSCETTFVRLEEDWKKCTGQRELVWVLSTDMSKAFDLLSHTLTLKRFEAYGLESFSLHLMRSFFENRMNRVKISNAKSEWKHIKRGYPQGSSFGPLIWNLFQQVTNSNLTMYAGDHQMYKTGSNLEMINDCSDIGSPESRVFILVALACVNTSNSFNIMTRLASFYQKQYEYFANYKQKPLKNDIMLNTDNPFTFSQSLKFKTIFNCCSKHTKRVATQAGG